MPGLAAAPLEEPVISGAELVTGEHVLKQRSELGSVQPRESHQTGVQPLELTLGHRVEIDAANALLGTRALQPTQQNLGSAGIGNSTLAQPTLDLRVTRRIALSARCSVDFRPHAGEHGPEAAGRRLTAAETCNCVAARDELVTAAAILLA